MTRRAAAVQAAPARSGQIDIYSYIFYFEEEIIMVKIRLARIGEKKVPIIVSLFRRLPALATERPLIPSAIMIPTQSLQPSASMQRRQMSGLRRVHSRLML